MNNIQDTDLDGESLGGMIFEHKNEPDREAFSAVWVNELSDVIMNMDEIKNNKKINNKN